MFELDMDDLAFSDAVDELPDSDPDVVAGMRRLRAMRAVESDIPDLVRPSPE